MMNDTSVRHIAIYICSGSFYTVCFNGLVKSYLWHMAEVVSVAVYTLAADAPAERRNLVVNVFIAAEY